MNATKLTIGRAEDISLPDVKLFSVPAKTDTGAYSSAIHAVDIEERRDESGRKSLSFQLLKGHSAYTQSAFVSKEVYRIVTVHNSFGQKQKRYVVPLTIVIAGETIETEFTLANRSKKLFPVLLGRKLLKNRFLVDVDQLHLENLELDKIVEDWQDEENV